MWHINSITVPEGYGAASIYGGLGTDVSTHSPGDRLGPQGSTYFFSVEGLGSFFLEDVGAIGGPGDWAVQLNGTTNYWYYDGEGQGDITINTDGTFTITGGVGSVSGSLVANMVDVGPMTQALVVMVMGSATLQQSWSQNAINTMYMIGFPETAMINMDADCCQQFIKSMQGITFSQVLTIEEHFLIKQLASGWWSCTLCSVGYAGLIAATMAVILTVIWALLPGSATAVLSNLSEVSVISASSNVSTGTVASLATNTYAQVGAGAFLDRMVQGLCEAQGYC